jgi:hypothetical protein
MTRILFAFLLAFASVGPASAALKIQSWTLANGAKVLFVENHSIPILDISVEFDAGSRRDPQGKAGTAELTNAMLARGIRESATPVPEPAMTEAQISDAFADTAAQRGGGTGGDRAGASLRTLLRASSRIRASRKTSSSATRRARLRRSRKTRPSPSRLPARPSGACCTVRIPTRSTLPCRRWSRSRAAIWLPSMPRTMLRIGRWSR